METLRAMNQSPLGSRAAPDRESYVLFVHGCAHLLAPESEERHLLLTSAFCECCHWRLLTRIIWEKFCGAMRPEVAHAFMGEMVSGSKRMGVEYEEFPEEWSRIVEKT